MMKHWVRKFHNAFRGIYFGSIGESSFAVHAAASILVILLAIALQCSRWEWCILLLCISLVFSLELVNSALEHLARGLSEEPNADVGRALDISSGAVLCASLFVAIVGLVIFVPRLLALWQ